MEDAIEPRVQPHRLLASFFLGVSLTLLLTSPLGPERPIVVSPRWVGLWLVATLGCAVLGGMLLLRKPWRELPMGVRRGPAMMYLLSVGIDSLALAVLVSSYQGAGPWLCLPIFAGFGLAYLYRQLYAASPEKSEDLFP
jgi:hypothetical protein